MPSARDRFNTVTRRAQREAFAIVEAEIKANVPTGWRVCFAVGWGFSVFDAAGKTVIGTYANAPPMPRKARTALLLAADYCDRYGEDNSIVKGGA